jgi:hypothetical protein
MININQDSDRLLMININHKLLMININQDSDRLLNVNY